MSGRLDGKVAVITGAGGGMGREAALLFSAEGASVCVADVDGAAAERRPARHGRRSPFRSTWPTPPASRRCTRRRPSATAGSTFSTTTPASRPRTTRRSSRPSPDAWQRVQDVNTKGVYLCCKYGIPHLLERGGGSVINVASFVAVVGAATSQISYTASKGAVLSLSRELGVQFARQGISVNALCPGPVETPLLLRIFGDDPAAYERRRVHWPMGRLAKPREIVNAALFLASDESSYVNAATFLVDGGLTASYVTPE